MEVNVKSYVEGIMQNAPPEMAEFEKLSKEEKIRIICEDENAIVNEEENARIPCDKCHGKGYYYIPDTDWWKRVECGCMKARRALRYVEGLGLLKDVQRCNFDTYVPYDEPTTKMKEAAQNFREGWLYLGGQSGSGKTHLAYSIFGKMVKKQKAPQWMQWIQESQELKMMIGEDEDGYNKEVSRLMNAEILFIDDFFNIEPTQADIRLARTIIDNRYSNDLMTIITSELTLAELNDYDDAIAGRIAEKATVFQISGNNHNYRMRNYL